MNSALRSSLVKTVGRFRKQIAVVGIAVAVTAATLSVQTATANAGSTNYIKIVRTGRTLSAYAYGKGPFTIWFIQLGQGGQWIHPEKDTTDDYWTVPNSRCGQTFAAADKNSNGYKVISNDLIKVSC